MNEEWRDIEGYEGYYQVSSLGNLKSLDRVIPFYDRHNFIFIDRIRKGNIMHPGTNPSGYLIASLTKDAKVKYASVHRLVAKAFLKNTLSLPQINHKDGNKKNNEVSNLEWCSPSHNILHAYNVLKVGNFMGINQFSKI